MEELKRQLKIKQIIRKKFQNNHENRIHQLEDILANQGLPRIDINSWSYSKQAEAKIEFMNSKSFSIYNSVLNLENICIKLRYIERDFYEIMVNPKKRKRILLSSISKHLPTKRLYSTFGAVITAMMNFMVLGVLYYFLIFIIKNTSEEVVLTSFQTSFFGMVIIPLITILMYLMSKGRKLYVIIPIIIWLKFLMPYILDLDAGLVSVHTSMFKPATCVVSAGETDTEHPCIYLNELFRPIIFRDDEINIDNIEVVHLKYHKHTQHWQDLEFDMIK